MLKVLFVYACMHGRMPLCMLACIGGCLCTHVEARGGYGGPLSLSIVPLRLSLSLKTWGLHFHGLASSQQVPVVLRAGFTGMCRIPDLFCGCGDLNSDPQ